MADQVDAEFNAIRVVYSVLQPLPFDAQSRVLEYVCARLGVTSRVSAAGAADTEPNGDAEIALTAEEEAAPKFSTMAELYDAAQPKSQPEKALVGSYWLQVCQGAESFDGFSVNKELKNLGEGIGNITQALDLLKAQKPALALQLKKSGKSRQARKTYKITVAGIKSVESMIGG